MGKQTAIAWSRSTFSPWWGCQKVSPACAHCYAERDSTRWGKALWGAQAPRQTMSDEYWKQPARWNRQAEREGMPWRVFCGSMCDILEDREDVRADRARLWDTIEATPSLTWLLLTKRPEHFLTMTPEAWRTAWPRHAWAGTTVENQEWADRRIPALLRVPTAVKFLSCEPLLEPIDLTMAIEPFQSHDPMLNKRQPPIGWVIVGGESGPHARPMDAKWVRQLRDQCRGADVCFFFKQGSQANWPRFKEFDAFPDDLKIREVPA